MATHFGSLRHSRGNIGRWYSGWVPWRCSNTCRQFFGGIFTYLFIKKRSMFATNIWQAKKKSLEAPRVLSSVYVWQISFDVQLQIQSVTWRSQKQKRISLHIYIFLQKMPPRSHMPSHTCQFNFQSVNRPLVFLFTSHTTCQNLYRACYVQFISVQVFACQMPENFVRNTQWSSVLTGCWDNLGAGERD